MFVKQNPAAPPGFYEVEAAGLRWLGVPDGVPVVQPLEVSPGRLVLPRLTTTSPTPEAAENFGRRLARTHRAGAEHFGVPPDGWGSDGYIGTIPLPHAHEPPASWGEFYAHLRLRPYVRAAYDAQTIDSTAVDLFERVCKRLEGSEYDEPVSRLHGDLWSGNVLWTAEGVCLIDPAAHGGHRETDLAMLDLFGLPELERVLGSYTEVYPLAGGWRERVKLHQLHPLLVHVVLFGAGYVKQAIAAARDFR